MNQHASHFSDESVVSNQILWNSFLGSNTKKSYLNIVRGMRTLYKETGTQVFLRAELSLSRAILLNLSRLVSLAIQDGTFPQFWFWHHITQRKTLHKVVWPSKMFTLNCNVMLDSAVIPSGGEKMKLPPPPPNSPWYVRGWWKKARLLQRTEAKYCGCYTHTSTMTNTCWKNHLNFKVPCWLHLNVNCIKYKW